ncbi:GGDEF domain-containing protein [Salinicola avicenniae]|uniref:GGDEF domain-containing protein n=1 Tax=Salinicola avicenniae TaxID=2916836 RepID=UPI0020742847|nr:MULTISPECIES: GGDEF domain-containing protein [unclassified Salinicola]
MLKSINKSRVKLLWPIGLILAGMAAVLLVGAWCFTQLLVSWQAMIALGIGTSLGGFLICRHYLQKEIFSPLRQLAEQIRLEQEFGHTARSLPATLTHREDVTGYLARQLEKLIEELRNHNAALLEQTLNDPLTGLGNRRMLEHRLNMIVPLSRRLHCTVSAIMIDVDHFKAYNDNYGHPAGDVCLVEIAGVLRDTFRRETDVVVRLGGEEFLVLLINTGKEEAWALADAMRGMIQALGLPHDYSPVAPVVTVSVGVVTSPNGILVNIDDMIACADEALYDCKAQGRNRVSARLIGTQDTPNDCRMPGASAS